MRITSRKCTLPTPQIWQTKPLTAPRQRLIHTNPARRLCKFHSAGLPPQCLVKLQFRDRLCIDTRIMQQPIMTSFDGSAHLGYPRVHSHPHCVASRLQICSAYLHMFLPNLAGSPHCRRILIVGNCLAHLPHNLGIMGAERNGG